MANKTRELILDAFITLARTNPQRTSFTMTEIAAEAGISRQAIYQNTLITLKILSIISTRRLINRSLIILTTTVLKEMAIPSLS